MIVCKSTGYSCTVWRGVVWSNICVLALLLFGLVNKLVKCVGQQATVMATAIATATGDRRVNSYDNTILNAFSCHFWLQATAAITTASATNNRVPKICYRPIKICNVLVKYGANWRECEFLSLSLSPSLSVVVF